MAVGMFDGKVAIVTGAGSGIGRATAQLLARHGARVVVADLLAPAAAETVSIVVGEGGVGAAMKVDVSQSADVQRMIAATVETFGRLDVLVNNAGIVKAFPAHETPEDVWNQTLAVNLTGVFLGCKYAIPVMLEGDGGAIVNVASALGLVASPNQAAYCASKGGVVALTRQIAIDYSSRGIRCNCVCPGDVLTPLQQRFLAESADPDATFRALAARHPIGRFAQPEEIAQAILYLASDGASFVTGVAMPVDGGFTAI